MKKAYYYFLFRIYRFYRDKYKESESQALFSVVAVSTVITYFVLLFIYGLLNYYDLMPTFTNKAYVIPIMIVLGLINYILFVRKKQFLKYNFQKNKKGGIYIIIFILLLGVSFITLSNLNRKKIFKERGYTHEQIENGGVKKFNPNEEPTSLIGDLQLWYYNTFEREDSIK